MRRRTRHTGDLCGKDLWVLALAPVVKPAAASSIYFTMLHKIQTATQTSNERTEVKAQTEMREPHNQHALPFLLSALRVRETRCHEPLNPYTPMFRLHFIIDTRA